jgi:plasmid stabilization system protein ParE
MRIRLAPQARSDLDEIWLFIARDSQSAVRATRVVESITGKFALFAQFPSIGKSLDSVSRPHIHTFPVSNYVIFYSVKHHEVRILRIIHASRDAYSVFANE